MIWMILRAEESENWVIAKGNTTLCDFIKMAFAKVGFALEFKGEVLNENGYVKSSSVTEFQLKLGKELN